MTDSATKPPHGVRQELVGAIPNLRAFAVALCGDVHLANDLVQETLLKAWTNHERFEAGTNLRAWLFTILRNTYFSIHRKARREIRDEEGEIAGRLVTQPDQLIHLEMIEFRKAMDLLPSDQREALLLVGAEGFSYDEAAAITGCAVGTIKSRVNRARGRLVELLDMTSTQDIGSSHHVDTSRRA